MRLPAPVTSDDCSTPEEFISNIESDSMRADVQAIHDMITEIAPGLTPQNKFKNTLGYGSFQFQYKTGRQGEWCKLGVSYGKQITLHCCGMINGRNVLDGFAPRLKKAKVGMNSLRFHKLDDLNRETLRELIDITAKSEDKQME